MFLFTESTYSTSKFNYKEERKFVERHFESGRMRCKSGQFPFSFNQISIAGSSNRRRRPGRVRCKFVSMNWQGWMMSRNSGFRLWPSAVMFQTDQLFVEDRGRLVSSCLLHFYLHPASAILGCLWLKESPVLPRHSPQTDDGQVCHFVGAPHPEGCRLDDSGTDTSRRKDCPATLATPSRGSGSTRGPCCWHSVRPHRTPWRDRTGWLRTGWKTVGPFCLSNLFRAISNLFSCQTWRVSLGTTAT